MDIERHKNQTLEAKVAYDVDVLSCSASYVGVARVFDYFMREEKIDVKDMMDIPSGKKTHDEIFIPKQKRRRV